MNSSTTPTSEQNAQAIAQLTAAVDVLVTQFIRPNAQQANANRESINEVVELLNRHARAIVDIDEQQQVNAQQIAAIGDRLAHFDDRLEETRQLVAKNASNIAQITVKQDRSAKQIVEITVKQDRNAEQIAEIAVKQDRNAEQIAEIAVKQDRSAEQIAEITVKQDRSAEQIAEITVKQDRNAEQIAELRTAQRANATQIEALAEASRTQLAGTIGNGRRIDRLEQQAS